MADAFKQMELFLSKSKASTERWTAFEKVSNVGKKTLVEAKNELVRNVSYLFNCIK